MLLGLVSIIVARTSSAQPVAVTEPIELLNQDMSGWVFDLPGGGEGSYTFEDGILKLTGQPVGPIRTEAEYTQYKLTCEWRWPEGVTDGNSGLLIHCGPSKGEGKWPKSLEPQLRAGDAGDLVGIGGYGFRVAGEEQPSGGYKKNTSDGDENQVGQWNTMVLVVDGSHVTVEVNGKQVHECWDTETTGGAIGIQSEGKPIEFRSLRLEPLALSPADPIDLFNGEDFTGWTFDSLDTEERAEVYTVEDGILKVAGNPRAVLRTQAEYRDYEIEVQWRWPDKGGNSGLLIHTSKPRERNIWPKSLEVQLQSGAAGDFWMIGESIMVENFDDRLRNGRNIPNLTDDSERPVGEWNTMVCHVRGDSVKVYVNGELVNECWEVSAQQGAICLQSEGTPVEFRKVQIRPLPEQ